MSGCTDCAKPLGRLNKSGYCRTCFTARHNASDEMKARRHAGILRKFEDPVYRAEHAERLRRNASQPHVIELKREHGRRQYREYLNRPDIRAVNQSAECRARAGQSTTDTRLGWCPPDRREEYRELMRSKRLTAAEARAVIEADLPGTSLNAQREVANHALRMRLKHEREQREAY